MQSRVAVITGGSRGLGRSAAIQLAKRGVHSVITWHSNQRAAHDVVKEIERHGAKGVALRLDVADVGALGDFVGSLKGALNEIWHRKTFDALVNNAGIGLHRPFAETSEAEFDSMVNVHLKGPFFLTQKLLPLMADGGRIVNVSTGLARFSIPGYAAYASMKGAMEVLTRYLAKELGARRIVVNALAPGAIATDFGGGAVRDNTQLKQMLATNTALGRVGEADDIGPLISSLLMEENGWINGQRLEASGGMFL
jgi:NAD(P)-dependent dehydrogenase (short-subunit alcohol dehydrogenase family)